LELVALIVLVLDKIDFIKKTHLSLKDFDGVLLFG
jgi:hypothetical protein